MRRGVACETTQAPGRPLSMVSLWQSCLASDAQTVSPRSTTSGRLKRGLQLSQGVSRGLNEEFPIFEGEVAGLLVLEFAVFFEYVARAKARERNGYA